MKPFIYVHELIENSGGIWIGCPSEDVVRKSHTEGETGEEVIALVKLSDVEARIEELEEILKKVFTDSGFRCLCEELQDKISESV